MTQCSRQPAADGEGPDAEADEVPEEAESAEGDGEGEPGPEGEGAEGEGAEGEGAGDGEEGDSMGALALREAQPAIEAFGMPTVSRAYAKAWSAREDALLSVYKQLNEAQPPPGTPDWARIQFRGAAVLAQRGARDNVFAVFKAARTLIKFLVTDFAKKHRSAASFRLTLLLSCLLMSSYRRARHVYYNVQSNKMVTRRTTYCTTSYSLYCS